MASFLDLVEDDVDGVFGLHGSHVENHFPVCDIFAGVLESVHDAAPVGKDCREIFGALKHTTSCSITLNLLG